MAMTENTGGTAKTADKPLDPQSLSVIERIFYYEQLGPQEANNDNKSKDSSLFDSWAKPDYMRN